MTATLERRCTCHSIRENSAGQSYSYHMLGVLCPSCESAIAEEQFQAEWDALEPAEQVRREIASRWDAACSRVRNMYHGSMEPPF